MSSPEASSEPTWRRRVQGVLEYFGLASDDQRGDPGALRVAKPDWERVFFAVAVPLWATDRVDGWWLAVVVLMAVPSGVIEFVRWRRRAFDRGRVDGFAVALQAWALGALGALLLFGNDLGAARALAITAAFIGAVLALWTAASWLLHRHESRAGGTR